MNILEYLLNNFDLKNGNEIHGINRTKMAKALSYIDTKIGAEIGVAEGIHAEVLCNNIPGLKLHLVDAWMHYPGYSEYEDLVKCMNEAVGRLKEFDVEIHRKYSMDALRYIPDGSLDFVYLDAGHDFKNVAMDIYEWTKKVRIGGVVFGHDYKFHRSYYDKGRYRYPVHVKKVVDTFSDCFGFKIYVLANDVNDPTFGRDNPGWMFIKDKEIE